MITLITPTGGRPEAFAKCAEMMRAQTYPGDVRWVVVDDAAAETKPPSRPDWEILYVRRRPFWQEGQNTLAKNLWAGMAYATERVAIIEDDDAYEPWWLAVTMQRLDQHDLVGEAPSLYVNQATGNRHNMGNYRHASLCATAFKGRRVRDIFLAVLDANLETGRGIDLDLWRRTPDNLKRICAPTPRGVVGMKSWPGRPGIGVGHRL